MRWRIQRLEDEVAKLAGAKDVNAIDRRLAHIEGFEPAVIQRRVADVEKRLGGMTRALYAFAFSILASAIIVVFTVLLALPK
jgi:hypothetical protein